SRNPREPRPKCRGHPAVVIDRATAHDLEVLRLMTPGLGSAAEGVSHAASIHRVLRHTIDAAGRRDTDDVQDSGNNVVHMMELRPRYRVRLDSLRPANNHRISGAAKM